KFTTWSTLVYPYLKNGQITMDASQNSAVATTPPNPTQLNWGLYTTLSANRLGFFEVDGYDSGGNYFTTKGPNLSTQDNLSSRAMFTTDRDPDTPTFGIFYFDSWLACNP